MFNLQKLELRNIEEGEHFYAAQRGEVRRFVLLKKAGSSVMVREVGEGKEFRVRHGSEWYHFTVGPYATAAAACEAFVEKLTLQRDEYARKVGRLNVNIKNIEEQLRRLAR